MRAGRCCGARPSSKALALEAQDLPARRSILARDEELHLERVLALAADDHVRERHLVLRLAREPRLHRIVLLFPPDPVGMEMLDHEPEASFVLLDRAHLVEAG